MHNPNGWVDPLGLANYKNSHLENHKIHESYDKFYIQASELLTKKNITQRHLTNDIQRNGSPLVGHNGVKNLTNKELVKYGGPKGDDPISGSRDFQKGDDFRLPGSKINIQGGHHRLEEIATRVSEGIMKPETLMVRIYND